MSMSDTYYICTIAYQFEWPPGTCDDSHWYNVYNASTDILGIMGHAQEVIHPEAHLCPHLSILCTNLPLSYCESAIIPADHEDV